MRGFGALGLAVLLAGVAQGALSITVNPNSVAIVSITSVTGTGTSADPIVINENWFGASLEATIDIRGALTDSNAGSNPAQSGHLWGVFVKKKVTNNSGQPWSFFDNELQEVLGTPSANGDGLSFCQGQNAAPWRPFTSDLLPTVMEIQDPRDYVNFSGGSVGVGQTVTMNFVITDNSPLDLFYLRQRPNFVPEPGGLALLALGAIALFRRR